MTNPKEALEWYERKQAEARAMADRDCKNCKYHKADGCSRWECEYEPAKSDLISRQDAIEAVQKVWCNNDDQKDFKQRYYEMGNNDAVEDAIGYIDALPSADRPPGWIPVSERLPEEDGRYLVTYPLLVDDLWVSTAWYGTPPMPSRPVKGKCFFISDDEWGDVPYDDVVAWMPLPEPYKGGDDKE